MWFGFFAFFLMPFGCVPGAADPSLYPGFLIWSCLTLILGLAMVIQDKTGVGTITGVSEKLFVCWMGYALAATLSLTRAVNPGEAFFAWSVIILSGSFLLVCGLFFHQYPRALTRLSRWATGAGFAMTAMGLAGGYWRQDPPFALPFLIPLLKPLMINKNLYASALFLLIPFVVHTLVSDRGRWRLCSMILLPLLWALSLVSGSRAVWLAMVTAVIPVLALIWRYPSAKRETRRTGGYILVGVIILMTVFAGLIGTGRSGPLSDEKKESAQLRLSLWSSTLDMIQDNPLLGVGPGQWRLVLPRYSRPLEIHDPAGDKIERHAQRPHNDFLWICAENGTWGLVSYLAFWLVLMKCSARLIRDTSGSQRVTALAMIYGISGYFVISLFSFPRERPLHGLWFMTMVAWIWAAGRRRCSEKPFPNPWKGFVIQWVLILLVFGFGLNSGLRLYSDIHLKKAWIARSERRWEQVVRHIDHALWKGYCIDPAGVPLAWYRGMAHYELGRPVAALADFEQAVRCHPYHFHSRGNLDLMQKAPGTTDNPLP